MPAPERSPNLVVADRLAVLAMVLAATAAGAGLAASGLYRDTAEMVREARAADLVTLTVAVPTLAFGLAYARTGSASARMVTLGALGYLAYSYAIYAFSVVINPLTPLHLAILGLTAWSFVLALVGFKGSTLDETRRPRLPRRTTAIFLLVVVALFAVLWLSQIAGAITSGRLPASIADLNLPTNAVYPLDLAFALPLLALAGGWLLRRDHRGPAAAVAALTFTVLMGLSVLTIFAVDAAAGLRVDAAPITIFAVVTATAAGLVIGALSAPSLRPNGDLAAGPTGSRQLPPAGEPPRRPTMTTGPTAPAPPTRPASTGSATVVGSTTRET